MVVARILLRAVGVATVIVGGALIGSDPAGGGGETNAVEVSLASQQTSSDRNIHLDVPASDVYEVQIDTGARIRAARRVVCFRVSRCRISIRLCEAVPSMVAWPEETYIAIGYHWISDGNSLLALKEPSSIGILTRTSVRNQRFDRQIQKKAPL